MVSSCVQLPAAKLTDAEAPSVMLDFGRELTGRVEIDSDSDEPMTVTVQVGESESEAMKVPYLGVNQMTIPPHGTGHRRRRRSGMRGCGFWWRAGRCASSRFMRTTSTTR